MPETCPQCGAALTGDRTCQSIFDEFLVLEFTDPGYGAVHMLTVACYMIQHGQYSDDALVWMAQTLRDYLEHGKPVQEIRQQAAKVTGQGRREWKVMRSPDAPPQAKTAWSMTIQDVERSRNAEARSRNAEARSLNAEARDTGASSYCALITEWARVTLKEMQPLIQK